MVLEKNAYRILAKKPEGMGLNGKPSYLWKDNINMDFELGGRTSNEFMWLRIARRKRYENLL
jgi:hypothetical protein